MDFPSSGFHLPVISSWSAEAIGGFMMNEDAITGGIGGSAVWPTANLAMFVPFSIRAPYLVRTLWWCNGTSVAGNVDCGVYTADGTLEFSAGSTAQATVSSQQKVSLGTPYLLLPGSYYMALVLSSTSGHIIRRVPAVTPNTWTCSFFGMAQQATALPLPAAATFASPATPYLPMFGIAKATVV